jgi:hypothetical protein
MKDTVTIKLPKAFAKMALEILTEAEDAMGSNGCNDYTVKNTKENRKVYEEIEAANQNKTVEQFRKTKYYKEEFDLPEDPKEDIFIADFTILWYLGKKIRESIKNN